MRDAPALPAAQVGGLRLVRSAPRRQLLRHLRGRGKGRVRARTSMGTSMGTGMDIGVGTSVGILPRCAVRARSMGMGMGMGTGVGITWKGQSTQVYASLCDEQPPGQSVALKQRPSSGR